VPSDCQRKRAFGSKWYDLGPWLKTPGLEVSPDRGGSLIIFRKGGYMLHLRESKIDSGEKGSSVEIYSKRGLVSVELGWVWKDGDSGVESGDTSFLEEDKCETRESGVKD
jgi:hypothetical protein